MMAKKVRELLCYILPITDDKRWHCLHKIYPVIQYILFSKDFFLNLDNILCVKTTHINFVVTIKFFCSNQKCVLAFSKNSFLEIPLRLSLSISVTSHWQRTIPLPNIRIVMCLHWVFKEVAAFIQFLFFMHEWYV